MSLKVPNEPPRRIKRSERITVLALSGGGYRGLFSAIILEKIFEHVGHKRFWGAIDVFSGTSAGGLLAIGLSAGIEPKCLRSGFERNGSIIFDRRISILNKKIAIKKRPSSIVHRALFDMYSVENLENAIREILGKYADIKLSEHTKKLVVPAVCATTFRPMIFRSFGANQEANRKVTLADVARATSAAPTYFKPMSVGSRTLVDGGLVANAPEMIAISEVIRNNLCALENIRVISIGTATPSAGGVPHKNNPKGISRWLVSGLFELTAAAQEKLIVQIAEEILKDSYLRIDATPTPDQSKILKLDNSDTDASEVLKLLAEEVWENADLKDRINKVLR